MEFEGFKSAWQRQSVEGILPSSRAGVSRSVQFVRTGAIRDLQRSEELARVVFCLLFGLVAIGGSFLMMAPGAGRVAAWLFALALIVDSGTGLVLLARRFRDPAMTTTLEFIRSEYRQVETRLRLERISQPLTVALAAAALLLMMFTPRPIDSRASAFDSLGRMAIVTAFLAFAWRRSKSRSPAIRRELEHYLKDLQT